MSKKQCVLQAAEPKDDQHFRCLELGDFINPERKLTKKEKKGLKMLREHLKRVWEIDD